MRRLKRAPASQAGLAEMGRKFREGGGEIDVAEG